MNTPMDRAVADRFAHRHLVDFSVFNGDRILRYLQVTRRSRWLGAAAGLAFCFATITQDTFFLSPYFPVAGWLLGAMAAEIGFARSRARGRRPLGIGSPLRGSLSCGGRRPRSPVPSAPRGSPGSTSSLSTARAQHLTGPLADKAVPEPTLSYDGRHVSLTTATGVELIDTRTDTRSLLPGVRHVLGLGPDGGGVATTGRRALAGSPDTELVTFDRHGGIRTRVPFDPTLSARPSPDGRTLAIVALDEIVTMDPGTGEVRGRARLRLPAHHDTPEPLGWDEEGRLLVRIAPDDSEKGAYHLVDPATGKSRRVRDIPDDLRNPVFGRVPSGEGS
ncbi:hypothetical protein [Nonomuraea sp. NPDC048916]|uniref:hypothetical protein n=1 Tax=Nonomuraea sp. NPDC048916 TaxID=3154232 RepID=UPI0033FCB49C